MWWLVVATVGNLCQPIPMSRGPYTSLDVTITFFIILFYIKLLISPQPIKLYKFQGSLAMKFTLKLLYKHTVITISSGQNVWQFLVIILG